MRKPSGGASERRTLSAMGSMMFGRETQTTPLSGAARTLRRFRRDQEGVTAIHAAEVLALDLLRDAVTG